jgi:ribosomal protein S18 acetylase RimI-like enzyme
MSRPRLTSLTIGNLSALPMTCPSCLLGPGIKPGLDEDAKPTTWARSAQNDWGFCGVGAYAHGAVVGYLLISSPLHVPRTGPQSGGLNPDAAVMMSLRVVEPYAGCGLGRQLVQSAAARLIRTQFEALEVRGSLHQRCCALPPVGFLESVGFLPVDDHPLTPRMRLEFSRTLRWVPDLRPTLERLVGWVRPLPPAPAGPVPAERQSSLSSPA